MDVLSGAQLDTLRKTLNIPETDQSVRGGDDDNMTSISQRTGLSQKTYVSQLEKNLNAEKQERQKLQAEVEELKRMSKLI